MTTTYVICDVCKRKLRVVSRHDDPGYVARVETRLLALHKEKWCRGIPIAPRFTGFDGIPDWDDKDNQIARLCAANDRMQIACEHMGDYIFRLETRLDESKDKFQTTYDALQLSVGKSELFRSEIKRLEASISNWSDLEKDSQEKLAAANARINTLESENKGWRTSIENWRGVVTDAQQSLRAVEQKAASLEATAELRQNRLDEVKASIVHLNSCINHTRMKGFIACTLAEVELELTKILKVID